MSSLALLLPVMSTMPEACLQRRDSPSSSSSSLSDMTLRVEKLTNRDMIAELQKISHIWAELAKSRFEKAKVLSSLSKEKIALAEDSKIVTAVIADRLQRDLTLYTIYAAYDEQRALQGIALAKITTGCNRLECLTTHPQNLAIFDGEQAQKGVGRKLITSVMKEVYLKTKVNQKLFLMARPTAMAFYKNLGFIRNVKQHKNAELTPMVITRDKMALVLAP